MPRAGESVPLPLGGRYRSHPYRSAQSCQHPIICPPDARSLKPALAGGTQALWGKCGQPYMRARCDRSCGRCAGASGRPVTVLSSRQAAPCNSSQGDAWVERARANKAWFAGVHGWRLRWSAEQVDPDYAGAWNKLALLRRQLREELNASIGGTSDGWILWLDWDVLITDAGFGLPLDEYEERHVWLALGGDARHVLVPSPDYLRANTGVMLLRVHQWSLALVERLLATGAPRVRRRSALAAQAFVRNLCVGCLDDQAALLVLLREQPDRWRPHTLLERRFPLQSYWADVEGALPAQPPPERNASRPSGRRTPGWPSEARMLRAVHGSWRVPFAVHFAGCQLCSGKLADLNRSGRCAHALERTLAYTEQEHGQGGELAA